MILDYATAKGHRQGDNPAQSRRLSFLLPNVQRRVTHRAALPWSEVPALMAELSEWPGGAVLAVRFPILNASRSGPQEWNRDAQCGDRPPEVHGEL